jgi:CRISPR type III-B/RAMP module RAMP protein Cmr1
MSQLSTLLPSTSATSRWTLQLSFTAITPIYLGGPNNASASKQDASIRGALHRWLWMLLGGVEPAAGKSLTPFEVANADARVFGTTNWSPNLSIRFAGESKHGHPPNVKSDRYLYVEWPMVGKRQAWPPGTTFTVEIDAGPRQAGAEVSEELRALAASCWCWATLGWLGARGRRGFGALRLESVEGHLADVFTRTCGSHATDAVWIAPEDPENLSTFLATGLNGALEATRTLAGRDRPKVGPTAQLTTRAAPLPPPRWPALAPGYWRLLLVEYKPTHPSQVADQPPWANALAAISTQLREFREDRSQPGPGYKSVDLPEMQRGLATPAMKHTTIDLRDDEFGLPRRFEINKREAFVTGTARISRRPSPVIARPFSFGPDGAHVGVLWLALRGQFLPGGAGVRLASKSLPEGASVSVKMPPPDLPRIKDFMDVIERSADQALHADLSS